MSYGVGFRWASIESTAGASLGYRGLDFTRLALGTDFYPVSWMGFGPYLEASIGATLTEPSPASGRGYYGVFELGLHLAFDLTRAFSGRPSTPR